MTTHTLEFRPIDYDNFTNIKLGIKTIETRAASERYLSIAVGDILRITCGDESVTKRIVSVRHFPSLDALLQEVSLDQIMPDVADEATARERWASYPGYQERIQQYGIIAWELA